MRLLVFVPFPPFQVLDHFHTVALSKNRVKLLTITYQQ